MTDTSGETTPKDSFIGSQVVPQISTVARYSKTIFLFIREGITQRLAISAIRVIVNGSARSSAIPQSAHVIRKLLILRLQPHRTSQARHAVGVELMIPDCNPLPAMITNQKRHSIIVFFPHGESASLMFYPVSSKPVCKTVVIQCGGAL